MAIIDWFAWLLRVLWACRISVINAAAGLLFFGYVVQAQNLMADLSSMGNLAAEITFWLGVFAFTFLLWAFPVHYGARRTLDDPSWILPHALYVELKGQCAGQVRAAARGHETMILWVPRILGITPFIALALGIHGALNAIGGASDLPETALTRQQAYGLYAADAVAGILFLLFVWFRARIIPDTWTGSLLHPLAMAGTAACFAIAYLAPIETSVILPRALLVPPLFGSLVLLLSWLQRLGHRTGFPFLTALTVTLAIATGLNVDFNRLRTLPGEQKDERLVVADAVARWKTANDCSASCPRPIVIAIDGGASRAAFTAATFVGELLDRMPAATGAESPSPGRRIFALSGVSGGAYGAAVIQAALADSQAATPSKAPPCRSAQTTWFGYQGWSEHGNIFTWRQCLQALTSGDYLSATIVGLAFRDFIAPPWQKIGLPAMADRAALLEMTWERQYSATLRAGRTFFEGGNICGHDEEAGGLCRRAAHPAHFFDAHKGAWIPMLLLNSTSVATGRRVISSDVLSTKHVKDDPKTGALYKEAYDLREAMSEPCPDTPQPTPVADKSISKTLNDANENTRTLLLGVCVQDSTIKGPDVRLSTAALTSARFPLISPAGIFDMQASSYGDQLVDGGYFENSGLTTALEVVMALRANGLNPLLVSISNDPALNIPSEDDLQKCAAHYQPQAADNGQYSLGNCTGLPRRPAPTPLMLPDDNTFLGRIFGVLSRPAQTLLSTGNGHAYEALGAADAAFPQGGFHRLRVEVQPIFQNDPSLPLADDESCKSMEGKTVKMAKVSMSWWLAASVQADLDIQRCSLNNRKVLRDLLGDVAARATPPDEKPKGKTP